MTASIMDVEILWLRLERWLAANALELFDCLNPGATRQEVTELEERLGCQLPQDYVESCLLHNGQAPAADGTDLILVPSGVGGSLLSIEWIAQSYAIYKEDKGRNLDRDNVDPVGPVKKLYWSPKWIPFTSNGSGDYDCLDLDPEKGGHVGQIITFFNDSDTREVIAPSFTNWLLKIVEEIEEGDIVFHTYKSGARGLVRKQNLRGLW